MECVFSDIGDDPPVSMQESIAGLDSEEIHVNLESFDPPMTSEGSMSRTPTEKPKADPSMSGSPESVLAMGLAN